MNIQDFYQKLDQLFAQHDMAAIEKYMTDSLTSARLDNEPDAIVAVGNELAGFYWVSGKVDDAIRLSQNVLQVLKNMGQETTENFAVEKERPEYQDQLDVYNALLKETCEKNGARYVELAESLKGEDNLLRLDYSNDKVCHLNDDGIAVWIQVLKDYAQEQYELGLWDPFEGTGPETDTAE